MSIPKVFLVDSSIYVFRAWFTLPDTLVDANGKPANAVYGFTDFVASLLTETGDGKLGFAFDESLKSSFRNELYPPYKANREPAPAELIHQFSLCREFVTALGLPCFSSDEYEADDLIGTVARYQREQGHQITIVSADKDLAQLITEQDLFWDYAKNRKLKPDDVFDRYGVRPDQIADQLALAGDSVDNIPGVRGIGMATAAKLLNKFDTLDEIIANLEAIAGLKMRGAKRVSQLLSASLDEIPLYRKLTGIECSVSMPAESISLKYHPCDHSKLHDLFDRLGFGNIRRERWQSLLTQAST